MMRSSRLGGGRASSCEIVELPVTSRRDWDTRERFVEDSSIRCGGCCPGMGCGRGADGCWIGYSDDAGDGRHELDRLRLRRGGVGRPSPALYLHVDYSN